MADVIVAQRMWQRRDTAANWTTANPVLAAGEWGIELASNPANIKAKIGDGSTPWNTLPYYPQAGSGGPTNTDALPEGTTNLYFTDARARAAVGLTFPFVLQSGASPIPLTTDRKLPFFLASGAVSNIAVLP